MINPDTLVIFGTQDTGTKTNRTRDYFTIFRLYTLVENAECVKTDMFRQITF